MERFYGKIPQSLPVGMAGCHQCHPLNGIPWRDIIEVVITGHWPTNVDFWKTVSQQHQCPGSAEPGVSCIPYYHLTEAGNVFGIPIKERIRGTGEKENNLESLQSAWHFQSRCLIGIWKLFVCDYQLHWSIAFQRIRSWKGSLRQKRTKRKVFQGFSGVILEAWQRACRGGKHQLVVLALERNLDPGNSSITGGAGGRVTGGQHSPFVVVTGFSCQLSISLEGYLLHSCPYAPFLSPKAKN